MEPVQIETPRNDPASVAEKGIAAANALKSMGPNDPAASAKVADVVGALQALAEFAEPFIPVKYKLWFGLAVGVIVGVVGGYVGKGTPPVQPPAVVNVTTNSPITKPAASIEMPTLILYLTAKEDGTALAADPLLKRWKVQVDHAVYDAGMVYPFGGKEVPIPCAAYVKGGAVVDVAAFKDAHDLAAWAEKVK